MADTFEYHDPEPNVIDDWTYTMRMLQDPDFKPQPWTDWVDMLKEKQFLLWAVEVAHEMHEEKIEQNELAQGLG